MADIRNLFMSHRHEDDALVDRFKTLMKTRGVEVRDSSITSDNPNDAKNHDYIKREILKPGIDNAGAVVVLITPDTKNHAWVDWEIEYAVAHDKPIIGVWAPGSAGCDLPQPLAKYADAVVGWNAERILEVLDGAREFENSDGSRRQPQPTNRIGC